MFHTKSCLKTVRLPPFHLTARDSASSSRMMAAVSNARLIQLFTILTQHINFLKFETSYKNGNSRTNFVVSYVEIDTKNIGWKRTRSFRELSVWPFFPPFVSRYACVSNVALTFPNPDPPRRVGLRTGSHPFRPVFHNFWNVMQNFVDRNRMDSRKFVVRKIKT